MAKQARITIVFDLPKEDEAKFEGRGLLMITPLTMNEQMRLALGLRMLQPNSKVAATPNVNVEEILGRMTLLEILGRAVFVGGDSFDLGEEDGDLGKEDGGPVQ